MTTFNDNFVDLYYELNDSEIFNDILLIQGASGSEVLIRGYDATAIDLYGMRSKRLNEVLAVDQATGQTLVEANLDRYIAPYATLIMSIIGETDTLITQLLTRVISDKVTIVCADMGLSADFIIESVELSATKDRIPMGRYTLIQLRAGE